jgi:putative transposase
MNSFTERWGQTCRRELLDRTLIWNQRHLLHALREFEDFYNSHRPHQGIANARLLHRLPEPIADPTQIAPSTYEGANAWAASSTSTSTQPELEG